jgi:C_GCAxxG_C_C family probable redox protein
MKRREFVKNCSMGVVFGGFSAAGRTAAPAAEEGKKRIDPDKLAKTALEHFLAGKRTCCESILMAGCEALGVRSDLVPDIALGLAGGIGMRGETCGVLTSSALVLSLAVALKEKEYPKKVMRTMECVGRVHRAFKKQCGCTDCRSLTGLDLTTPEGRQKLKAGVRAQKCAKYVVTGAKILGEELKTP